MFLLFDIGGTKTRLAVSSDGRRFRKPVIVSTPRRFDRALTAIRQAVQQLTNGRKLRAAAGGVAGPLDAKRERLVNAPHLKAWLGKPLKRSLERALGAPVTLENDAAVVGLGEATHGAGRGFSIVAYLTVSTGVGGARIVDGQIDRSAFGFEPGHQVLHLLAARCQTCGLPGDLESLVSGSAFERRWKVPPRRIRNRKIWHQAGEILSLGLVNLTVFWSPEVIVLGGSMFKQPGIAVPLVRRLFRQHLKIFPKQPRIVPAALGDVGGLFGALELLRGRDVRVVLGDVPLRPFGVSSGSRPSTA